MNLQDLRYLVAVADKRHFGKAARACFVSQPTLSMQLKKLEEFLGVQLFERSNKQVVVTSVGKQLVEDARDIVQRADSFIETARTLQNPLVGEIKIGAFPTLAPYMFPKIVPSIIKSFPELKLFLIEEKTDELVAQLLSRKIDAALLAFPITEPSLEHTNVLKDPFLLAVPRGHALANRKRIATKNLAGESLLLLEEGHCLRNQALDICSLVDVSERQDFRATSLETLRQMVVAGMGATLMPKLAIGKNDKNITYIPFKAPTPARTVGLFWRKNSSRVSLFREIASSINAIFS